ncbi:MAG: helix-turn-helix domain-containing protein [Clostridiales bacterium]|nr:helix-turn-helix domain-containing protein [Clostridiales bacterium]
MENKFDIADFVKTQTIQSVTEQLVEREKQRRKKMRLSQRDLANKSGVSYASIRRFESIGEISFNSLLKIANALDCLEDFNLVFKMPAIKSLRSMKYD